MNEKKTPRKNYQKAVKHALGRVKLGSLNHKRPEDFPEGDVLIDGLVVGTWEPCFTDIHAYEEGSSPYYHTVGYRASLTIGSQSFGGDSDGLAVYRKGTEENEHGQQVLGNDPESSSTARARLRFLVAKVLVKIEEGRKRVASDPSRPNELREKAIADQVLQGLNALQALASDPERAKGYADLASLLEGMAF